MATDDTSDIDQAGNDTSGANQSVRNQLTIESQINVNIARIERLKEEAKPLREMMSSMLENSEEYVKATDEAKKASGRKSEVKRSILSTTQGKELEEKIRLVKDELSEAQEALSHYLREYSALTGSNEFEGEDGELRQIVYVAKLVRKTNLQK